jgi:arylformamidase
MRIYDVTLTISPDLPVWPDDAPISLERLSEIKEGATSNVTRLSMSAHSGTHVDAPRHFIDKGESVDELDLKLLTGRAYVLHVSNEVDLITRDLLERSGIPPRTKRVLFRTRNSNYWADGNSDFQENYVALDPQAAEYLIKKGVKVVGVDYLSVAPFNDVVPTHQVLLGAGIIVIEGLDLSQVSQGRYSMYCLPLKLAHGDGAPARVILVGV